MIRISNASTTNVYGRLRAMRTNAVIERAFLAQADGLGFAMRSGNRWRSFT
jgi:hypothetical protein